MQLKGVLVMMPSGSSDAVSYLSLDDSLTEFRPLDTCPEDVQKVVVSLCDSADATPLGVLVDLGGEAGAQA